MNAAIEVGSTAVVLAPRAAVNCASIASLLQQRNAVDTASVSVAINPKAGAEVADIAWALNNRVAIDVMSSAVVTTPRAAAELVEIAIVLAPRAAVDLLTMAVVAAPKCAADYSTISVVLAPDLPSYYYDLVWGYAAYPGSAASSQPTEESIYPGGLVEWIEQLPTPSDRASIPPLEWVESLYAPAQSAISAYPGIRKFLPSYQFDGTTLSFSSADFIEQTGDFEGDFRYFLWAWLKRVWAWNRSRQYIATIPVSYWLSGMALYPLAQFERYGCIGNGENYSYLTWGAIDWSQWSAPGNKWLTTYVFPNITFSLDGRINIPLTDMVGLSASDADANFGSATALIHAFLQNSYHWYVSLPDPVYTVNARISLEVYNKSLDKYQAKFDFYILVNKIGNLSGGELLGE